MWPPQTGWLCVRAPQNLCHFLSHPWFVKPSESAPFSCSGVYTRATGLPLSEVSLQVALVHVVIHEDEPFHL